MESTKTVLKDLCTSEYNKQNDARWMKVRETFKIRGGYGPLWSFKKNWKKLKTKKLTDRERHKKKSDKRTRVKVV